ncbi:MAG: icaA, partial [Gemmataceae bacterium]|nr:icaA [Gemmataceae bacterium]
GAVVSCAAPARAGDLDRQRRRWRAALLAGGWRVLPTRLVRSKPLVLAHLAATAAVVAWGGLEWGRWWAAGLVLATAAIYLRAVVSVGLSGRRVGLLLRAPWVVARLGWVTVAGLVRRDPGRWDRGRNGEGHPDAAPEESPAAASGAAVAPDPPEGPPGQPDLRRVIEHPV